MNRGEARPLTSPAAVIQWLAEETAAAQMHVRDVKLRDLSGWRFLQTPLRLAHESGQFFSIIGIRHWGTFGSGRTWDQPMIDQPEVGILGMLTQTIHGERCVLAQAKLEPGNTTGAQLGPTVQATRSNYLKVHGGRVPPYLEYFREFRGSRLLVDQMQSEQASRFLYKRNRNMLVESQTELPVLPGFRWVPWSVMLDLLRMDNIVNMDARSVISCVPPPGSDLSPKDDIQRVLHWFTALRADFPRRTMIVGLDELSEWSVSDAAIERPDGRYFSVIGIDVEIRHREVSNWKQPLLKHHGRGLNGMLVQRVASGFRFLLRGCCYPGSVDNFELGSTISLSDYELQIGADTAPAYLDYFTQPGKARALYSSMQCEEGGRFLQYENRYMVVEADAGAMDELPAGFVWMTLGEIYALLPHGYFSIEARNLLACIHTLL